MMKLLDSPAFWAATVLAIFATGVIQLIPAHDLNRIVAHLL